MKPMFLALALATVGSVAYHLGQKLVPPTAHPMVVLMAAYAVAFLASALVLPFVKVADGGSLTTGMLTGTGLKVSLVLGLGVLLIEVGFLLAYRLGASLQWSGVAVNGAAALMLVPLALAVFKESFAPSKLLGMLLVLAGLALLSRK